MAGYAIRYLPSDPFGRAGAVVGDFPDRDTAESVARAMANAAHVEVIERRTVEEDATWTEPERAHADGCLTETTWDEDDCNCRWARAVRGVIPPGSGAVR